MVQTQQTPHVIETPDPENLAQVSLNLLIRKAHEAIREKGVFYLAVSGGHTPSRLFELMGKSEQCIALEWDKIQLFWVDERCVPPESPDSNYGLAARTFLENVKIPAANIHRIKGENPDCKSAASDYQQELRGVFGIRSGEVPQFDLMVLGMGADGHTGSLFPNSFAPFETHELAMVVYLMSGQMNRITVSNAVLLEAKEIIVLVQGAEKAQTLRKVLLSEPDQITYPIHALWPILERVTWITDADAASLLPRDGKRIDLEKKQGAA
jgi:6-phosphogluconolactonase